MQRNMEEEVLASGEALHNWGLGPLYRLYGNMDATTYSKRARRNKDNLESNFASKCS